MKKIILLLVTLALAAGAGFWWKQKQNSQQERYRTAVLDLGDIVQTVRTTGTVQPIRLVDVGTQVNGPVLKLLVDFNDTVKAGDIVAQIDPSVYDARLAQDQANLHQSEANVEQAQAKLSEAEKQLVRAQELSKRDMISQAELDTAVANRDSLAAQVRVSKASVEQAKASLQLSQANLGYTTIRSPVDGVVIARNVSEGQTVVASMSAQVLFKIATDLSKVQVEASVPEADIGRLKSGQKVVFTVDAFEEEFQGVIDQVRMSATTAQNVVTYPVVILADNPDRKLFPGMTANIICEVSRHPHVLRAPNAALRFKPSASARLVPAAPADPHTENGQTGKAGGTHLWLLREDLGNALEPVAVSVGVTDGACTELKKSGPLKEGSVVVLGLVEKQTTEAAVNPFAPPRPPGGSGSRRSLPH